jgi:hypothetical protein
VSPDGLLGFFWGVCAAQCFVDRAVLDCWTVRYPALADYLRYLARWFRLFRAHDSTYRFAGYSAPDWPPYPYVLADGLGTCCDE